MKKERIQNILCISLSITLIGTLALGINKSRKEKSKILECKKQYESSINLASKPEGDIKKEEKSSEASKEKSTLEGKALLSLGDGVSKESTYQEKVKNILQLKNVTNKSDSGLAMGDMSSYINKESLKDIDIIIIMAGTNDYTKGRTLGTIADGGPVESFYGDVQAVINKTKEVKPEVKLVFLTPLKHGYIEGQPSYPNKNDIGLGLEEYSNAIKEVCNKNSIPVIDLFNKSGIETANIKECTVNNMILNEVGNEKVAKAISDSLKEIYK